VSATAHTHCTDDRRSHAELLMPPDGNCFFHAVGYAKDPDKYKAIERNSFGTPLASDQIQLESALAHSLRQNLLEQALASENPAMQSRAKDIMASQDIDKYN
jgi:hypothetical protein